MDVTKCRVCGCEITLDNGYRNGGGKPGLRTICKSCNNAESRERRSKKEKKSDVKKRRIEVAPRKRDIDAPLNAYSGEDITDYLLNSKTPGADYNYDYGLYLEALDKDPHLSSVWMQRKSAVLSKRREMIPADDTAEAEYAADFHAEVQKNISIGAGDSGFERDLSELLNAVPMGIAVSELIWDWVTLRIKSAEDKRKDSAARADFVSVKMAETGLKLGDDGYVRTLADVMSAAESITAHGTEGTPRKAYIPVRILSRHPRRFKFDENARLMLRVPDNIEPVYLPDYKFLVFRPYSRYEDPYGLAGMRVVWWMTWFKRIVMNYWVRFTEVYVDPLAIVESDQNAPMTDDDKADTLSKLNTLQAQTGIILPPGAKLIFQEPQRHGSVSAYKELIDFANAEMSKAIIGQTLTTEPGHRGARSLGEVQEHVARAYTTQDAFALMALVNGTLIPWIHKFNIPDYPLPHMDINTEESNQKLVDAEMYSILYNMNFPLSIKHLVKRLGVPAAHDPADMLLKPEPTKEPDPGKDSAAPRT